MHVGHTHSSLGYDLQVDNFSLCRENEVKRIIAINVLSIVSAVVGRLHVAFIQDIRNVFNIKS